MTNGHQLAATLEQRGYTYRLPSGLYFDTARFPRYGELARLHAEGQREAARVEQVAGRRRTQAREERDWARADQIRAELDARGVQVTDTPEGAVWQLR